MASRQSYFVGVDVGSGSARVCIIDHDGNVVATALRDIQTWQSQQDCYEQSSTDIWMSICDSVRSAIAQSGLDPKSVASIAFTATCSLAVFSLKTGKPISVTLKKPVTDDIDNHNVVLWMHRAAVQEADYINTKKHRVFDHLGGSISPFMALPKLLWLKNNLAKEQFNDCRFYDLHDALVYLATNTQDFEGNDENNGDSSPPLGYGVDGTIKGWNSDLLKQVGLEEFISSDDRQIGGRYKNGQIPAIGSPVGSLSVEAASQLGLSTSTIVATGTIDCYAGWIGTVGAFHDELSVEDSDLPTASERLAIVAGTSACHILSSDKSHFVNGLWGPYENFLLPGSFVVAGGQPAVGRLLEHVIQIHPAYHEAQDLAKLQGQSVFDCLNEHLHRMQSNSNSPSITHLGRHVFFYGDHFGNRTPLSDARMTGSVAGLTGDVSLDNLAIMYYSAMESITLQTRHIIETMTNSGHKIRSIFMSGSLCQNKIFVDLLALTCNMPVVIPQHCHPKASVSYGATLLAAHAAELVNARTAARTTNDHINLDSTAPNIKDSNSQNGTNPTHNQHERHHLWDVMTRLSKPGKVISPSGDEYTKRLLQVKYTIFLEQAERQRIFRKMIDDVSRDEASFV